MSDIKKTYTSNGFTWTSHLEDLMQMYAGKKFLYPHPHPLVKEDVEACFYAPSTVQIGTEWRGIYLAAKEMGEEVTHVGSCNNGNIELLLTVTGRLIGEAYDSLFSWSDSPAPNWRQSIEQILQGVAPTHIAAPEMEDDPDIEAFLGERRNS